MSTLDPKQDPTRASGAPVHRPATGWTGAGEPYRVHAPPGAEPRRRRSRVPWLLAALVLAVGIWALSHGWGDAGTVAGTDDTYSTVSGGEVARGAGADGVLGTAVQRFATWANEGGTAALPQESEESHPYTARGIRLLSEALRDAALTRSADAGAYGSRIDAIGARAEQLQQRARDDRHAEHAHAAFVDASRLLSDLGSRSGDALLGAAHRIEPSEPLSPQGEQVRAFFRQAAAALQQLTAP